MIVQDKYDFNKTRYTHRDYNSIKEDLISAIPSLTQEWTSREETDPGIVLIKLMSMFGDTLSYNIDKIALELYLQTVTQRKNCSRILKLLGYKMHWYRSAKVNVSVRLRPDKQRPVTAIPYYTQFYAGNIPYSVVRQENGLDNINISRSDQSEVIRLAQGVISSASFTKKDLIDNKYYLNTTNVDESNFLLTRSTSGQASIECTLVDNLYLQFSNDTIYYEFDVDEYDRPYIRLADNWSQLTSENTTFNLRYLITLGSSGNVTSNAFTRVQGLLYGSSSSGATIDDIIVTNLPNTTQYGVSSQTVSSYNSAGHDPQTVDDARADAANYVFTHDSLVSSSDYEKAAKRVGQITVSKLVDSYIADREGLKDIVGRADDEFVAESGSLKAYQAILYLAYRDFDPSQNYYFMNADSPYSINTGLTEASTYEDPYDLPVEYFTEAGKKTGQLGYYPYKLSEIIQISVNESLSSLKTLNVKLSYGTIKLFPFKVKGEVYLREPLTPQETLQVVNNIDMALSEKYYPEYHESGELPSFIEIVTTIQESSPKIKYFDAYDQVIEWAPLVKNYLDQGHQLSEIIDTTSAIKYNGLSKEFTVNSKFMTYTLKNIGTAVSLQNGTVVGGTDGEVVGPVDYAFLTNLYTLRKGNFEDYKISYNTTKTIVINTIEELRALVTDLSFVGTTKDENGKSVTVNNNCLECVL